MDRLCDALLATVFLVACTSCGDPLVPDEQGGADGQTTSTSSSTSDSSSSTDPSSTTQVASTGPAGDTSESGSNFLAQTTGDVCDGLPEGTRAHCTRCDLFGQDCPEGFKCTPWSNDGTGEWNAARCVPLDPRPAAIGEPCDASTGENDDCELSAMCWDPSPQTLIGTCVGLCEGSSAAPVCSDAQAACVIANEGLLPLCLPECDPLEPSCGEGEGCYPTHEAGFVCIREGALVSVRGVQHTACPAGSLMVGADLIVGCEAGCCASFCSLDETSACAKGQTCTPYFDEGAPDPDHADVGICLATKF